MWCNGNTIGFHPITAGSIPARRTETFIINELENMYNKKKLVLDKGNEEIAEELNKLEIDGDEETQ